MNAVRRRRLLQTLIFIGIGAAFAALVISSLTGDTGAYLSPSQLTQRPRPAGAALTLGGWVKRGSLNADGLQYRFVLADSSAEAVVHYEGILPDLFAEGEAAIAEGRLAEDGSVRASRILARHDENYRPPGVEPPAGYAPAALSP